MGKIFLVSLFLVIARLSTVIDCVPDTLVSEVAGLKTRVDILDKKTEFLQDVVKILQRPGVVIPENSEYENFRTEILETIASAEDFKTKIHETIANAEDLKSEVNSLIQSSHYGFMNEKEWNREFMANLTRMFQDFETDVTMKNKNVRQRLAILNAEFERKDEICNKKLQTIEAGLNEGLSVSEKRLFEIERKNELCNNKLQGIEADLKQRLGESEKRFEQISKDVDGLRANQLKLESENLALGKTIHELQTEHWAYFNGTYYLVVVKLEANWDDALDYCKSRDSHLIEITTDEKMQFVEELVQDYQGSDAFFWIGVNDRAEEGTFIYPHSREKVPEKFWGWNQPNNLTIGGHAQHCVMIYRNRNRGKLELNDNECHLARHFICEKPRTLRKRI